MPRYEYKVVPAPTKGLKGKDVKGAQGRFAYALQELMNGLSGYGWEYQRAETLPSTERSGLTGSTTEWRNMLVFRRLREEDVDAFKPELLPPPAALDEDQAADTPEPEPVSAPAPQAKVAPDADQDLEDIPESAPNKAPNIWDNGVEDTGDVKGIGHSLKSLASLRKPAKTDD